MKETVKVLELDKYEIGILINALNEFRNKLIEQNIDTYDVDKIILETLDAPEKKRSYRHNILNER